MGFFSIFKQGNINKPEANETSKQKSNIPAGHISKKKKNTYTIMFNVMSDNELMSLCKSSKLPVIEINGVKQEAKKGWITCLSFPNPCATEMVTSHDILREVLGDKISATIIEYLDKYTGKPVVQVYPEGWYVFDKYEADYMLHLNHASRRDLNKQLKLREEKIKEYLENQKQR
ncbi:MAG: hypothetical protein II208_03945 [Alphaproteobacteria bacterium]|nr:hypothetical protein [Alphaproteobacteria bacterium]